MNGIIGMTGRPRWFQSPEETKLKRDAPPFIPRSRASARPREEQKLPSLKPNAAPFIPRNRLHTHAYPAAANFPLYPFVPYYQPFGYVNYQLPFVQYLPLDVSPPPLPLLQQPVLRQQLHSESLRLNLSEIERNEEIKEDHSPTVFEGERTPRNDLFIEIDSESIASLEETLLLELDEEEDLALSKDLIDELTDCIPVQNFAKGEFNNDTCSVCLECFAENDQVKVLGCKHFFHQRCIDPWLKKTLKCPLCRHLLI
eukprot:TRINITY_DN376_c0_g4_i1.p1 TRINITY_DN376_c0_g4~~TRINITY_DN376_c0_g4_i1.p1  ORF type:complete len:256 (+),score=37.49 TRINITY_DN376_c0_g4_i1:80-847(+)